NTAGEARQLDWIRSNRAGPDVAQDLRPFRCAVTDPRLDAVGRVLSDENGALAGNGKHAARLRRDGMRAGIGAVADPEIAGAAEEKELPARRGEVARQGGNGLDGGRPFRGAVALPQLPSSREVERARGVDQVRGAVEVR